MSSVRVMVSIGDPWEFGEAIGWIKPTGALTATNNDNGKLKLDNELLYNGCRYTVLDVRPRYVGCALTSIPDDGVGCSFIGRDAKSTLRFTGVIYRA